MWSYLVNDTQFGPVDDAVLAQLLANGKITGDTLVWREGMANWTPLNSTVDYAPPPTPRPMFPAQIHAARQLGAAQQALAFRSRTLEKNANRGHRKYQGINFILLIGALISIAGFFLPWISVPGSELRWDHPRMGGGSKC